MSAESGLPTTWSARENIAWSAALRGLGSSSPIVWRDQVFVTSQVGRTRLQPGSHPMRARDDATLVTREKPIGGRRDDPTAGTLRCKADRGKGRASYSTPLVASLSDTPHGNSHLLLALGLPM